jgi:hypothetical protein
MLTQENIREIPVAVDFVAVPSTFDIELFLSMRESAGMFEGKETNMEHVKFVAETVKASPYFILSKTPEITIQSAFFCLEIFREAGLTIDSNYSEAWDSKFRGRTWQHHTKQDFKYESGHISQTAFLMIIVNLYRFVEEGIMTPIIEKIVEFEDRVVRTEDAMEMIKK